MVKVHIVIQQEGVKTHQHSARLLTIKSADQKSKCGIKTGAPKNTNSDRKRWKPNHSSCSYWESQSSGFSSQAGTQSFVGHYVLFLITSIQNSGSMLPKNWLWQQSQLFFSRRTPPPPQFSTPLFGGLRISVCFSIVVYSLHVKVENIILKWFNLVWFFFMSQKLSILTGLCRLFISTVYLCIYCSTCKYASSNMGVG